MIWRSNSPSTARITLRRCAHDSAFARRRLQSADLGTSSLRQWNVLIHIVCVPLIFFTTLILSHAFPGGDASLADIRLPAALSDYAGDVVRLTSPFLVAVGYASYFCLLEPFAGVSLASSAITVNAISAAHQKALSPR